MDQSRRGFSVLCEVVERYVRTGAPVASHHVARTSGLGLSPATIRNVMARLEEEGLLARSHASAGRIPTDHGFRRYVDSLVRRRTVPRAARQELVDRMAAKRRELAEDIEWVAEVTAEITCEAGVAVRPMGEGPALGAVSLVHLGGRKVLGVVITTDGTVEKKVLRLEHQTPPEDLQRYSNYLNRSFRGVPVERIRRQLAGDGSEAPAASGDEVGERATAVGRLLFAETASEIEVQVAGADHLLASIDFAEADRIRSLVATLQDRQRIVKEWRRALHRGGTQVLIGHESELTADGDLGMVATLFYHQGRRAGALGVVGPRRMDYGRIVPMVELIGDTLTHMLEESGVAHG